MLVQFRNVQNEFEAAMTEFEYVMAECRVWGEDSAELEDFWMS